MQSKSSIQDKVGDNKQNSDYHQSYGDGASLFKEVKKETEAEKNQRYDDYYKFFSYDKKNKTELDDESYKWVERSLDLSETTRLDEMDLLDPQFKDLLEANHIGVLINKKNEALLNLPLIRYEDVKFRHLKPKKIAIFAKYIVSVECDKENPTFSVVHLTTGRNQKVCVPQHILYLILSYVS